MGGYTNNDSNSTTRKKPEPSIGVCKHIFLILTAWISQIFRSAHVFQSIKFRSFKRGLYTRIGIHYITIGLNTPLLSQNKNNGQKIEIVFQLRRKGVRGYGFCWNKRQEVWWRDADYLPALISILLATAARLMAGRKFLSTTKLIFVIEWRALETTPFRRNATDKPRHARLITTYYSDVMATDIFKIRGEIKTINMWSRVTDVGWRQKLWVRKQKLDIMILNYLVKLLEQPEVTNSSEYHDNLVARCDNFGIILLASICLF